MQPDLFSRPARFDSGVSLTAADHIRLGAQLKRVYGVLSDGTWYTVPQVARTIREDYGITDPEPSISAQIRNLKKQKHGGHQIERRRDGNVWKFRLVTHVLS